MRRNPGLVIGAAAVALIAAYAFLWLQVSPARERGTDFSASYVAALLLREGHRDQLYDQAAEASRHAAILLPGTQVDLPFITPPATAALAVPLTLLDPGVAFRVFSALQLLLLTASVWVAARAAPWPPESRQAAPVAALAGLAGAATLPFLLLGQWDGVCALGVALGYAAWRRDRPMAAGAWLALGIGLAKPHLGLGLAAFILGRGELGAVAGAGLATLALGAVSVAAVGVAAIGGFLGAATLALDHTPAPSTMGLLGLAASWLGDGNLARVFALAGGIAGVLVSAWLGWQTRRRREHLEAGLAGALALSLVATPHLLAHDLVVLAPGLVFLLARAASLEPGRWPGRLGVAILVAWAALAVLISFDAGNGAPAPPGRLVPWGLLAAAVGCWALSRRPAPAAGT